MTTSSIKIIAVLLLSAATFTQCSTPAEKVENAQQNVDEANKNLDKANEDYLRDVASYKQETADRIAANDQLVAAYNEKISAEKANVQTEYRKNIAVLEQKNKDMKKKMDDYKLEGKEKWQIFKTEFNHDMDGLGKAFKDITTPNTH
jgi:exonuclease VII large subunit